MALVDLLADEGMGAANFVDASGGSGSAVFAAIGELVFERAERPDVDAILMFFTLTATSLDTVVQSLLDLIDARPPPKPLVVGLIAAGAAERVLTLKQASSKFSDRGYVTVNDFDEAIGALKKIVPSQMSAIGTTSISRIDQR
jgi:succinyl-CoA synthetase beta subunit